MPSPLLLNRGGVLRRGFIQAQDIDPNESLNLAKALGGTALLWDSVDAGVTLPAASITTPSLDQGFKHLMIEAVWSQNSGSDQFVFMRPNGDATAANYQSMRAEFSATTVTVTRDAGSSTAMYVGRARTGIYNSGGIRLRDYTNAAQQKAGWADSTSDNDGFAFWPIWKATAAITTLFFFPGGGSFTAPTRISVYGI